MVDYRGDQIEIIENEFIQVSLDLKISQGLGYLLV